MEIIKEKAFYGAAANRADRDVGMAVLENGVWLLIHEDGAATGSDGRRYVSVSEEVAAEPIRKDLYLQYFCETPEDMDKEPPETFPIPDTDLVTLGWTADADKPVIVQK